MRIMMTLGLLLLALPAWAQDFRISSSVCLRPGGSVSVSGSFSGRTGEVILVAGDRVELLDVRGWSATRVRLALPNSLDPGAYSLVWRQAPDARPGGRQWVALGTVQVCVSGGRGERIVGDVVTAGRRAEFMVSIHPRETAAAAAALRAEGAEVIRQTQLPALSRVILIVTLPTGLTLEEARQVLDAVAPSARIDLHHIYGFADGPRLYAASLIGDDPARSCRLRTPIAVGMIDGPLNPSHPALAGVETISTSTLDPGEWPAARDHGTAVAALMASPTAEYPGLAPGARIYAVTAFAAKSGGSARLEAVAQGLDWLAGQDVRIVNLSMEGSPNAVFEDILVQARRAGMVIVAAAGNEGTDAPRYPAASSQVIAVTAVDAAGRPSAKANTGSHIDLAAPGVDLYVAKGAGGGYRSGTSYAAPIVTALIARLADRGRLSFDTALGSLSRDAADLGPAGRDTQFGHGLVQSGGC